MRGNVGGRVEHCELLFEQPGREVVQIAPPREPLVRSARRREVDIPDSGLVQHGAEGADGSRERIGLLRAHANPEQLHLFIECRSVLEDAVENCCWIQRVGAQAVHRAAESGHVSEGL